MLTGEAAACPACGDFVGLETLLDRMSAESLRPVVEYLGRRLRADVGHQAVTFRLDDGALRKTEIERGPIGNSDLDNLSRLSETLASDDDASDSS